MEDNIVNKQNGVWIIISKWKQTDGGGMRGGNPCSRSTTTTVVAMG